MTVDLHKTIVARLEDAGRTLMTLPMPARGMPAGSRSAWPEHIQKYWDVFGHADQDETEDRREVAARQINRVRLQASKAAVDRLDEVLGWLWFIQKPHHRKAVAARMLRHPISERPVHSWKSIAKEMGTNRELCRYWYKAGVDAIVKGLWEA